MPAKSEIPSDISSVVKGLKNLQSEEIQRNSALNEAVERVQQSPRRSTRKKTTYNLIDDFSILQKEQKFDVGHLNGSSSRKGNRRGLSRVITHQNNINHRRKLKRKIERILDNCNEEELKLLKKELETRLPISLLGSITNAIKSATTSVFLSFVLTGLTHIVKQAFQFPEVAPPVVAIPQVSATTVPLPTCALSNHSQVSGICNNPHFENSSSSWTSSPISFCTNLLHAAASLVYKP